MSLQELDPVLAQQLGVLATKLWSPDQKQHVFGPRTKNQHVVQGKKALVLCSQSQQSRSLCGSVEEAWRHCFNRASRLRVSRDDFVQACEGLGFKHGEACFTELCSEKARTGMSRKEFGFLHTWMGRGPDRGFIDPPPSRWEKERRPWTPPQPVLKKFERRKKFKDCLLRSYGDSAKAIWQVLPRILYRMAGIVQAM